ncbi:MAG: hypothetical protein JXB47_02485 [Anaerolineae bacterium]|nr:hypothetical protein [Anaerolineae bacterium]
MRFTKSVEARPGWFVTAVIALGMAAFLFAAGLGPDALPYPTNSPYSDAAITHWPNALYMKQHPFAAWNPRIMSGVPFAANPLSKVWYPPQGLVFLLPPALHLNLLVWLHLALAGAGMWAWARATGMAPGPAALAACAYALAPKVIAHLGAGHLDLVYAAAWLPWVMWAVHKLIAQNGNTARAVLRLSAFAALMLLADMRLSLFGFALADVYGVWLWWTQPHEKKAKRKKSTLFHLLVTANALVLAPTAVQWAPLIALAPRLSRAGLTPADAGRFAITPPSLIGTVLGNRAGNHETMVYTGLAVLALAIVALLARPRALSFWGMVIAVAALYAMGPNAPLWPLLIRIFPPLLWFRVPSRAWFVAALAMPYLAGWGAQALILTPAFRPRLRLVIAALLSSLVLCGGFSTLLLSALDTATPLSALAVAMLTAGVIAFTPALRTSASAPTKRAAAILGAALTVVVVIDLAWFGLSLVKGRGPDYWLEPYRALAEYLREAGAGRVYTPSDSLPQQAAAYWEIDLFGGVDPFQLQNYVEMAARATGIPAAGYAPSIPPYTGAGSVGEMWAGVTPDAGLMSAWNVTHTVSAFPIEATGWRFDRMVGDVYVYENTYTISDSPPAGFLTEATYDRTPGRAGLAISLAALAAWAAAYWRARLLQSPKIKKTFHHRGTEGAEVRER